MMRVLTVRQPWAWAIVHGGKGVENRSRNIAGDYRGPVAIHAGLAKSESQRMASEGLRAAHGPSMPDELVFGAIIGVVDLVGAHEGPSVDSDPLDAELLCFQPGNDYGLCSEWAQADAWHLLLANPRPLATPLPFTGALGLRELDTATVQQILKQVPDA